MINTNTAGGGQMRRGCLFLSVTHISHIIRVAIIMHWAIVCMYIFILLRQILHSVKGGISLAVIHYLEYP